MNEMTIKTFDENSIVFGNHVGFGPDRLTTAAVCKTIFYPKIDLFFIGKVFQQLSDLLGTRTVLITSKVFAFCYGRKFLVFP